MDCYLSYDKVEEGEEGEEGGTETRESLADATRSLSATDTVK